MQPSPHIERLIWDEWNRNHISKHSVLPEEVEEVIAGDRLDRATYKGRLQLVGATAAGRILSVVVGPVPDEPNAYYVFSARPASRKERGDFGRTKEA
jgi:uncharacterized DUF497 family protein